MPTMPTVNINGTSVSELKRQALEALASLDEAMEKLGQMAPNGRDFQCAPALFPVAEREHRDRVSRLDTIKAEVEEIALHLDRVEGERNLGAAVRLARKETA
jgi:hypothetical protein